MPRFSEGSNNRLMTCDQRLVLLFEEVVSIVDCTVLCGARSKSEQDEAFRTGHSKVEWPNSKHNVGSRGVPDDGLPNLSHAIDVAPCPIDWKDRRHFDHFAGVVRAKAHEMEIPIRWGGAWNQDWSSFHAVDFTKQSFDDLVHYELGSYE